jgi:hypothetical protein
LFLPEALVWSSLIEEANVLRDEALKMVLSEDEHMVQQFAPQTTRVRSSLARMPALT